MKPFYLIITFCISVISLSYADETKKPVIKVPSKYSFEIPECDKIEVFLIGGVQNNGGKGTFPIKPYKQFSKIKKFKEIKGDKAKELSGAWRNLTFDLFNQAMCHFPVYGLRFYKDKKLIFETSICYGCTNFYYPTANGKSTWHGFRKKDENGKKLMKLLEEILPRPKTKPIKAAKSQAESNIFSKKQTAL